MQPLPKDFLEAIAKEYDLSLEQTEALVKRLGDKHNEMDDAEALHITVNALRNRMSGIYTKFSIAGKGPGKLRRLHDLLSAKYQFPQTTAFGTDQTKSNVATAPKKICKTDLPPIRKILFLAANPTDTGRLRLDEEIREIEEGLKRSPEREKFELVAKWAIRIKDLRRALLEHSPHIVHFSGHGTGESGLVLEDTVGQATFIKAETLQGYFQLCPNVECVLLNACYSQIQANAISAHVPYVIGMNQAIGDATAIQFAVGFYDALCHGRSIPDAYKWGITAIDGEANIIQRDISPYPESLDLQGIDPVTPILITSSVSTSSIKEQSLLSQHQFLNIPRSGLSVSELVGREIELLDLHSQFQNKDFIAISGMTGVGKTELAIQYAKKYRLF